MADLPEELDLSNLADFPDVSEFAKLARLGSMLPLPQPQIPKVDFLPLRNPLVEAAESNLASEFHRRLAEWINEFDASLDNEHEVGVRLVSFGQSVVFRLDDLGYWNPSLISFKGHTLDDGQPVELIQHVSQISILLMRLPRENPETPKKPIGFGVEAAEADEP